MKVLDYSAIAKPASGGVDIKYEKHNPVLRALSIPIIHILNALPARISRAIFLAFSGKDGDTMAVFKGVATFRALEVMYTFRQRQAERKVNLASIFWENFLSNARAIRNRLELVKKEILSIVQEQGLRDDTLRIISIGSGSARPVFEAIKALNGWPLIKMMLVDVDQEAIGFSKILAESYNVNHINWVRGNFFRLERHCADFSPDIVEMVGLLDYLTDEQAIRLLTKIFRIIAAGGYLITGHIVPNLEASFVTKGINWPMIYRTPDELLILLTKAGFSAENIRIIREPLGIHILAIAKKLV